MNVSQLLAVLRDKGFSLSVHQEDTKPVIHVRPHPDQALAAEIRRHRSSLMALAEPGDCVLCQAQGVDATVDGRWWCSEHWLGSETEADEHPTCSRCPAPLYRFTPTGEPTCEQHFAVAEQEDVQSLAVPTTNFPGDKDSGLDPGLKTKDIKARPASASAVAL